ncbi:hypothetical protein LAZ67_8001891 [Cordylochernes scorpioides]|uniref:Uncharacterized protein n=1 Tax=Cordylochernes scorpioides TaxID=51811 RepID=A0ABY6KU90_9ARAC|nr:hypothetical protein LAZ67_8001891 [Cordylochernes scorpioides]
MAAALLEIDMDPEQQLYTPKIEDIAVIEIIHTQDRGHFCDKDVWRHLRLIIGHDNNNRKLTQNSSFTHPKRGYCFDRDAWRHLRLFIGHNNNNRKLTQNSSFTHPIKRKLTAALHTQDRGNCCDRDVWRHLRLFIEHDNNRKLTWTQNSSFTHPR